MPVREKKTLYTLYRNIWDSFWNKWEKVFSTKITLPLYINSVAQMIGPKGKKRQLLYHDLEQTPFLPWYFTVKFNSFAKVLVLGNVVYHLCISSPWLLRVLSWAYEPYDYYDFYFYDFFLPRHWFNCLPFCPGYLYCSSILFLGYISDQKLLLALSWCLSTYCFVQIIVFCASMDQMHKKTPNP